MIQQQGERIQQQGERILQLEGQHQQAQLLIQHLQGLEIDEDEEEEDDPLVMSNEMESASREGNMARINALLDAGTMVN